jgi:hypothetical protein
VSEPAALNVIHQGPPERCGPVANIQGGQSWRIIAGIE